MNVASSNFGIKVIFIMSALCMMQYNLSAQKNYKVKYWVHWDTVINSWKDTFKSEKVISRQSNGEPWEIRTESKNGSSSYDSGFVKATGMVPAEPHTYIDKSPGYIAGYSDIHDFYKSIWFPSPAKKDWYTTIRRHYYDKKGLDTFNLQSGSISHEIPDTNVCRTRYDHLNRVVFYLESYPGDAPTTYEYQYFNDEKALVKEVRQNYSYKDKRKKTMTRNKKKVVYLRNKTGEIEEATIYKWKNKKWLPQTKYTYTWYRYDLKNEVYLPFFLSPNNKNIIKAQTEANWDTINNTWHINDRRDENYSEDSLEQHEIFTRDFGKHQDTSMYMLHFYPNQDIKEVGFYEKKMGSWVRSYMDKDSGMNYECENTYTTDGKILASIYKSPLRGVLRNHTKVVYVY